MKDNIFLDTNILVYLFILWYWIKKEKNITRNSTRKKMLHKYSSFKGIYTYNKEKI